MLSYAAEQLAPERCQAIFRTAELPGAVAGPVPSTSGNGPWESWGHIDPSFAFIDGELYAPVIPERVPPDWSAEHRDAAERVRDHHDEEGVEEDAVKGLIGTTEAARALGVSPGRVRQLLVSGQLPGSKVGREWLIRTRDLERYAALPPGVTHHPRRLGGKAPEGPATS